ncbi:hypothetical protein TNCV_1171101 [Trichonephila clavipes]|nr:hypothetical protein TNCV_1171101 [Trichonephila clavipes]
MMAQRCPLDMFTKGKIVGMLESLRSHTESVSNSECGPVCDLKTVAEVFKERDMLPDNQYPGRPKSHNPSPRPISGNKCVRSGAVLPEHWVRRSQSPQQCEFREKLFIGDSIMLACMPEAQPSLHSPHVCA